ncbi:hypothetical protein M569_09621 [Genlisea aurea]|uniref:RNase H type-1 domain-containing protein n=1 Tax=Genlisea aurea TaxID=192259 RepID=S8DPX3_9LAMI|nr:hypothetical protein M569_09621 [Genlisea aurea]
MAVVQIPGTITVVSALSKTNIILIALSRKPSWGDDLRLHGGASIFSVKTLVQNGPRWRIGDGRSINIWNDRWFSAHPISRPKLNNHEGDMPTTVADIRQTFSPQETSLILSLPLSDISTLDELYWHPTTSDHSLKRLRSEQYGGILKENQLPGAEHVSTVEHAETLALIFGIRLALDLVENPIMIESDSLLLVSWLGCPPEYDGPLKNLMNEIQSLLGNFKSSKVQHIYREAN